MRRKSGIIFSVILAVTLFYGAANLFTSQAVAAAVTPLPDSKFDTAASLADNLTIYLNKDVFIHLRSGKTLQGYVKSVGNGLVHLEKLAGKDFYDALIRIDEISAIEAKFREMK